MKTKMVFSPSLIGMLSVILLAGTGAKAHDFWNNGLPVPEWVKRACCGPFEAHNLRDKDVKLTPQGYIIIGWPEVIPYAKALPSPDGTYWAFYDNVDDGNTMHCFFAPVGST